MQVINEVFPTDPSRMQAMLEKGPDGPIFMVNLLKFKDKAEYEDGRETDLSGRDAYMIYGRAVTDVLPLFGGRGIFAGDVTFLALGQVGRSRHRHVSGSRRHGENVDVARMAGHIRSPRSRA
mgnify:CR=1 FL=1